MIRDESVRPEPIISAYMHLAFRSSVRGVSPGFVSLPRDRNTKSGRNAMDCDLGHLVLFCTTDAHHHHASPVVVIGTYQCHVDCNSTIASVRLVLARLMWKQVQRDKEADSPEAKLRTSYFDGRYRERVWSFQRVSFLEFASKPWLVLNMSTNRAF